jgi:hypothetical protein
MPFFMANKNSNIVGVKVSLDLIYILETKSRFRNRNEMFKVNFGVDMYLLRWSLFGVWFPLIRRREQRLQR